jgi:ribonuclease-3
LEYYQLAFRHRSLTPEGRRKDQLSNERLEYLGDAIISLIIADVLFRRFPKQSEGFLTNARSRIVKRDSLNRLAIKLQLDKLIIASKSLKVNNNHNVYGNALEALMGAIYLDYGYEKCRKFVEEKMLHAIDIEKLVAEEVNYKSRLIERCQLKKQDYRFDMISDTVLAGNQHVFVVELTVDERKLCSAEGSSKKSAEQNVAKKALENLEMW